MGAHTLGFKRVEREDMIEELGVEVSYRDVLHLKWINGECHCVIHGIIFIKKAPYHLG